MKKAFLCFLLLGLVAVSCFAEKENKTDARKYSSCAAWISEYSATGNVVYELKLDVKDIGKKNVKAKLFHAFTPFSPVIDQDIVLKNKKNKYEFSFIDPWGNKAFGWCIFEKENVKLCLDCKSFSQDGKNCARLYDDKFVKLHDTTGDENYLKYSIDDENKIKKLLASVDSGFFPMNEKDKILSVSYVGTINGMQIFKTELYWNLDNSARCTHRLVFIKGGKVLGGYYGIASDKGIVKNGCVVFEDIKPGVGNKIEVGKIPSEEIWIDGEVIKFVKY